MPSYGQSVAYRDNAILLHFKRTWNFAICNKEGAGGHYAKKISQEEKDKFLIISLMYGTWNKTKEQIKTNQNTHTGILNTELRLPEGEIEDGE